MPCVVEAVRLRRAPLTTQLVDTLYHRGSELYLLELFSEFENAFLVIVVCNYKYLQSVFNCFNFMCFQILLLLHVCKITMVKILFRYYNFIYKSLAQEILSHIVQDFAPNLWTVVPLYPFFWSYSWVSEGVKFPLRIIPVHGQISRSQRNHINKVLSDKKFDIKHFDIKTEIMFLETKT